MTGDRLLDTAGIVSLAPDVTGEMCRAGFWLKDREECNKVLMTRRQIERFNRACTEIPETRRICLEELPVWFDGIRLAGELAETRFPEGLYLNNRPVPEVFYRSMSENIRRAQVSGRMPLRYGTAVNRTLIKSCPCSEFLADGPNDTEWDQPAVCGVQTGEPLALYFETGDGRFTYVKSRYCEGFVPSGDLAFCTGREQWMEMLYPQLPLVVTGERVWLEPGADVPELSEKCLTMGTALPLCVDQTDMVANRMPWNNYVVRMPCRDAGGMLIEKKALIPMNRDVHVGYLPVTAELILYQAFKSLGNRYGWGGMLNSQDCSSFVQEVYRCFGLFLPRDTGWQAAMPSKKIRMESMPEEEKGRILGGLLPGTVLLFPGHEMLYLGKEKGRHYVLNDVSTMAVPGKWDYDEGKSGEGPRQKLRIRSVIINALDVRRPGGKTWMSEINLAVLPWEVL